MQTLKFSEEFLRGDKFALKKNASYTLCCTPDFMFYKPLISNDF